MKPISSKKPGIKNNRKTKTGSVSTQQTAFKSPKGERVGAYTVVAILRVSKKKTVMNLVCDCGKKITLPALKWLIVLMRNVNECVCNESTFEEAR